MTDISLSSDKELIAQIRKAIQALNAKFIESNEEIIREYLFKYEKALDVIEKNTDASEQRNKLTMLLNCARGYLEHSSNYEQEFLNEMGKSETLIKKRL